MLQSMGLQRVRHNLMAEQCTVTYFITVIVMVVNHSFRFHNDTLTSCTGVLGLYIYIKSFTGNPEQQLNLSKRSMVLTGKKQSQVNHLESRAETILK